jgi:hypothetical protein
VWAAPYPPTEKGKRKEKEKGRKGREEKGV